MGGLLAKMCNPPNLDVMQNLYKHQQDDISKDHFNPERAEKMSMRNIDVATRSKERIHDRYVFGRQLGRGGFGNVYKGVSRTKPKREVVIKSIRRVNEDSDILVMKEIEIMKALDHPNIVSLKEVYEDSQQFHLVMDYLKGGDLAKMAQETERIKEDVLKEILWQILLATNYLHANHRIHNDLKLENFVMVKTNSLQLKMIDFGLAENLRSDMVISGLAGSALYFSPESFDYYGKPKDIWSIGVIMYFLMAKSFPFDSKFEDELVSKIKTGIFDQSVLAKRGYSAELIALVESMLKHSAQDRVTAHDVLCNEVFKAKIHEIEFEGRKVITKELLDTIRGFRLNTIFKQEMLPLFARNFENPEHMANTVKLFQYMDDDFSGKIEKREILELFEAAESIISESEAEAIIDETYFKEPGVLTFTELYIITLPEKILRNESIMQTFFDSLDIDGNGQLGISDLHMVFKRYAREMDRKRILGLISECDRNDDREIDLPEFMSAIK
jgi:calcium-dependent protein kinase